MVSDAVLIRDEGINLKRITKIFLIIITIMSVLLIIFFVVYLIKKPSMTEEKKTILENPLKDIVYTNMNEKGEIDKEKVISQGVLEFDVNYINYILVSLGVNNLYKSKIGFGNPKVEFILDKEVWSSEIINGVLNTKKQEIEDEDIKIIMTKKEVVESLLVDDIKEFMIESVNSRRTKIEIIAGKPELLSKGYLKMYQLIEEKIK